MALSYTGRRNLFAKLCNNPSDTTTLSLGDDLMNQIDKSLLNRRQWWFQQEAKTATTVASTTFVSIGGDIERIVGSVYVTVSSIRYTVAEATSREQWDRLHYVAYDSDIPEYWYYYDGQLGLWPRPATAGNTITFNARKRTVELSVADYTTGTLTTTSTTGTTTTVTGSSTVWHTGMIGRFLRITDGNAANTLSGDHQWYEIAGVASNTSLTFSRPYGGTALAAASANYTIGQMSPLPEPYDMIPVHRALQEYYTYVDPNDSKAALAKDRATELEKQMDDDHSRATGGTVLDGGLYENSIVNPNLIIRA